MEFTGERVIKGMVTDDLYNEHITRYLFAAQYLKPYTRHLLDAGCGSGYGSFELSKSFESITAIDISKEAIEYAVHRYPAPNLTYAVGDCKHMSFEHKFDAVTSFEVIEHLDEVEKYLTSVKNALVPSGIFIVSTPNKKLYSDSLENYENPYHVKEYYLQEFVEILRGHFNYVQIFAQDLLKGIYIRQTTSTPVCTGVSFLDDHVYAPESSSFFIAICSDRALPEVQHDIIFPLTHNNIIAEKDKYIDALKKEVDKRDSSIVDILRNQDEINNWIEDLKNNVVERDLIIERCMRENKQLSIDLTNSIQETNRRDEIMQHLVNEITELKKWVEILQHEVSIRDESVAALQHEIKELRK